MLPHAHHDELSDDDHELVHQSADSILDYIKLIFHTDMGEGHLENFESGQGFDFDHISAVAISPIVGVVTDHVLMVSGEHSFIASEFYLKDDPFPDPHNYTSFSLRGPPSIS